jgi:undecaprenyl-diphosphatase
MEQIQAVDGNTLAWLADHHSTAGNEMMKFCSHIGVVKTAIAAAFVFVLMLYFLAGKRTALVMLAASVLALGLGQSAKYLIQRERPDVSWRLIPRPHTPSFPSGHSLNSMSIYGTFALLAARRVRRRTLAMLVLLAGFTMPLLIGTSRPYLGVHYPSDVLAGWTAGLACALLALWADRRWGDSLALAPTPHAAVTS